MCKTVVCVTCVFLALFLTEERHMSLVRTCNLEMTPTYNPLKKLVKLFRIITVCVYKYRDYN